MFLQHYASFLAAPKTLTNPVADTLGNVQPRLRLTVVPSLALGRSKPVLVPP